MADDRLLDLYQDVILARSQEAAGMARQARAATFDLKSHRRNPLCGDEVTIYVKEAHDGRLDLGCEAVGCAICRASAVILVKALSGSTPAEVRTQIELLQQGIDRQSDALLAEGEALAHPDMQALLAVRYFPVRARCALLPWETLGEMTQQSMTKDQMK